MTTFTPPPAGMLSEQIDLPDHEMSLGLMHMEGAGLRVCVWDGETMRHMAHMKARRWAMELEDGPFGAAFKPVAEALRNLSERAESILASVAAQRVQAFADMPVEGRA